MIEFSQEIMAAPRPIAKIKVLGVGGAGGNTVNSIIDSGYQGIEFIVTNTDAQALELSKAPRKIQLGVKSTKGLGTGANPELGKRAAEEDLEKIMEAISDADIVFLAGGMGGGTGSGALPVIARALKEQGILTIAVVTKPFIFEGKRRENVANNAVELLKKEVDTLIVVPNQKLLEVTDEHISMIEAFAMINEILSQSVKGISDIIAKPGHINVDFADVRAIMKDMGLAVMGTGKASGEGRAIIAAQQAISSPLLENMNITGARGVLLNITGGTNLGLHEISQAASIIYQEADQDAHIILGSVIDESLTDEVIVTIIATGFEDKEMVQPARYSVSRSAEVGQQPRRQLTQQELHRQAIIYQQQQAEEYEAMRKAQEFEQHEIMRKAQEKRVQEEYEQELLEYERELQEMQARQDEQAPQTYTAASEELEVKELEVTALEVQELEVQELSVEAKAESKLVQQVSSISSLGAKASADVVIEQESVFIDVNDLDVPAFLRKQVQKTQ